MKKYLEQPIITLKKSQYLTLIVILAPLLNFLSGINIDIYSPSMPSIASYFDASIMATKNTITITVLGWTIGALFFGVLIDTVGRKKTLICGILFYVIASLIAPYCSSIHQLMLVRFIQGFMISTITVGCRALIIDNISGPRYFIAILYTSIGYGLGPIIGPFVGGILQHYFGWKANFIALSFLGTILLFMLLFFVKESIPQRRSLVVTHILKEYIDVVKNKNFISGVVILGIIQIEIMLYPTLGPFIVQNILHFSALSYGNSALVVGCCYLVGTLINRILFKYIRLEQICYLGFLILLIGLLSAYLFSLMTTINLFAVMFPIMLICMSAGLIFSNVMGTNLKQFADKAGVAMAIQFSLLFLIASSGIFMISHVHIVGLVQLSLVYSVLILFQILVFFLKYRKVFD